MNTKIEQYKNDWDDIGPSIELNQLLRSRILSEVDNMESKKCNSDSIEMNFKDGKSKKSVFFTALAACIVVAIIGAGSVKFGLFKSSNNNAASGNNKKTEDNSNNKLNDEKTKETNKINNYVKCNVNKEYKYDLNGDGIEDTIKCINKEVLVDAETDTYEYDITVSVNKVSYTVHACDGYLEDYFFITDINKDDDLLEIGIVTPGPSDDPTTEFLVYDNNKITSAGVTPSYVDTYKFNNDGTFEADMRLAIIQTWYAAQLYSINDKNKIVDERQEWYYPKKMDLVLKKEIEVYEEADISSKVTKVSPQACYFDVIDNKEWAHLKFNDGTGGWIRVKDYCYLADKNNTDLNTIFDGLLQCD